MNDPMWDLADLSVEAGFGPEQDRAMMEAYYGTGLSPALYSRLEVYKAMSDLHWSVWGFVQHAKGNPAEDFWSYGLERLGRSKDADERRRFRPAPERGAYGRLATPLPVLRRTGSLVTQLRRDLRRRSWPAA